MTDEQAKLLAEKVWGVSDYVWFDWRSYAADKTAYCVSRADGMIFGSDSWESAFLAAGVEINVDCEDCPSKCSPELKCGWTYAGLGLGYRLLEPGVKP